MCWRDYHIPSPGMPVNEPGLHADRRALSDTRGSHGRVTKPALHIASTVVTTLQQKNWHSKQIKMAKSPVLIPFMLWILVYECVVSLLPKIYCEITIWYASIWRWVWAEDKKSWGWCPLVVNATTGEGLGGLASCLCSCRIWQEEAGLSAKPKDGAS